MRAAANIVAAAACTVATSAWAADFQPRACSDSDMPGLWRTMSFKEEPAGETTALLTKTPYEYMLFNSVSSFAYATGTKELTWTDEHELKTAMDSVLAASKLKGKFNYRVARGMIELAYDDKPWAAFKCVIAQADSEDGEIKRGDMVWYTVGDTTPYLKRVERKLTRPQ